MKKTITLNNTVIFEYNTITKTVCTIPQLADYEYHEQDIDQFVQFFLQCQQFQNGLIKDSEIENVVLAYEQSEEEKNVTVLDTQKDIVYKDYQVSGENYDGGHSGTYIILDVSSESDAQHMFEYHPNLDMKYDLVSCDEVIVYKRFLFRDNCTETNKEMFIPRLELEEYGLKTWLKRDSQELECLELLESDDEYYDEFGEVLCNVYEYEEI